MLPLVFGSPVFVLGPEGKHEKKTRLSTLSLNARLEC